MVAAGLAANTAAALLQRLPGHAQPAQPGHAAERFGRSLESVLPGAAGVGQVIDRLGDLGKGALATLGGGSTSAATPTTATDAYSRSASLR